MLKLIKEIQEERSAYGAGQQTGNMDTQQSQTQDSNQLGLN